MMDYFIKAQFLQLATKTKYLPIIKSRTVTTEDWKLKSNRFFDHIFSDIFFEL